MARIKEIQAQEILNAKGFPAVESSVLSLFLYLRQFVKKDQGLLKIPVPIFNLINGIVIKPNQVGTVIESLAIAQAAKETRLKIIVSHRSNETNDDFIADFSVAVAADYIKIGSLSRGENIAKYNRLLQIENQLKIL